MSEPCSSSSCSGCTSKENCQDRLKKNLSGMEHKIMVLSGKGGVGKSSVAVNLALYLALEGYRVGLLDIDFHGPSVPTMLGFQNTGVVMDGEEILPLEMGTLKVMSMGLLLQGQKDAVIWRGPMKAGVIKQLFEDVRWGELDYMIMDFPPGTGDEALSACQLVEGADGGIVVTTPQEVSLSDCRRCISFCRKLNLPVLGVIENMSGFVCPNCGTVVDIFSSGGGEKMAEEEGVPFLGKIPLDPNIVKACDEGKALLRNFAGTPGAKAFGEIAERITAMVTAETEMSHNMKEAN
jgi:Mrp family chromosome partitioning ATPase